MPDTGQVSQVDQQTGRYQYSFLPVIARGRLHRLFGFHSEGNPGRSPLPTSVTRMALPKDQWRG